MLSLISPPATEPVTEAEMWAHLRVPLVGSPGEEEPEDAADIAQAIATARARLDGRDGFLGRCLITQTWRLTLDRFPSYIVLPLPPCQAVLSIAYADPAGIERTLDPSAYQVAGVDGAEPARIVPAHGQGWPAARRSPEAVAVTFRAGYGDTPADVPETLRAAIKLHAAHLYEHRESVVLGAGFIAAMPQGWEDLVRDYRLWLF